jgi:hypothetical protein
VIARRVAQSVRVCCDAATSRRSEHPPADVAALTRAATVRTGSALRNVKIDAEAVHARNAPVSACLIPAAGTTLSQPGDDQPVIITNQMINALNAPVEAAWRKPQAARDAAAAVLPHPPR